MVRVHIAQRDDLQARMLEESIQVVPTHPAHANAGVV